MSSYLPQWIIDISTISSVIGLVVTIFLFVEARKIQNSFLRRARLPTITRELNRITTEIGTSLLNWDNEKQSTIMNFAKAKGLLENLRPKLPTEEQKDVRAILNQFQPRKHLIIKLRLSGLSKERAWELYTELNTIVSKLDQLVKDSKWD